MPTLAVTGRIAPSSRPAAMYVGGAVVEPTRTPIISRDDPCPCPCPCGRPDCDRDEWAEMMNADPHGDLSEAQSLGIPY